MSEFLTILFLLIAAHYLCDYPLQGEFLAQAKNRNTVVGKVFWRHALFAHAMIHGGAVLLVTGSLALAVIEVIAHAAIDWFKCENRITLNTDQAAHIACKFIYACILAGAN
jgi:hypothetical protein